MQFKRAISLGVLFSVLFSNISIPSFANEFSEPSSLVDEVISSAAIEVGNYSILSEESTTSISYAVNGGNIYFDTSNGMIIGCDKSVVSAVIPEKISGYDVVGIRKSYSEGAFQNCTNLKSVFLPSTIETIYTYSFSGCSGLESVCLSEGLKTISSYAFTSCTSLKTINLPSTLEIISTYAFSYCTSLENINLPIGVVSYKTSNNSKPLGALFAKCSSLKEIEIPDGTTILDDFLFDSCTSLNKVIIPKSVSSIKEYAFEKCDKLTIYCYEDSYAYNYAKMNNINYVVLKEKSVLTLNSTASYIVGTSTSGIEGLCAIVTPHLSDKSGIIWESSNPEIVEIVDTSYIDGANSDSLLCNINCKSAGTSLITVKLGSGLSANCMVTVMADSDDDGLPDEWEINGADVDGDGKIDIPLNLMGANPYKPDIYVETDWMVRPETVHKFSSLSSNNSWYVTKPKVSFAPNENVLKKIYTVFNNHNVNIHIDAGPDSRDYVTGKLWGSLSGGNEILYQEVLSLGNDMDNWYKLVNDNFDSTRKKVFRHCIFLEKYDYGNGTGSSGISNGIPGECFIVAAWVREKGDTAVAGTFMHELGHTIGLRHGGNNHENNKPNYLSIMNYLFQISGLVGTNAINYSEYELPTIDENELNENRGIDPDGLTFNSGLGTKWSNNGKKIFTYNVAGKAIDFNNNKKLESNITLDLNPSENYSSIETLESYNDWNNISFRNSEIGNINFNDYSLEGTDNVFDEYELTLEDAENNNILGNPGSGAINFSGPYTLLANRQNQNVFVDVVNLAPETGEFNIHVESNDLMETYTASVKLEASDKELRKQRIAVPLLNNLKVGTYKVKCTISSDRMETYDTETEVTVYNPTNSELNALKDAINNDELDESPEVIEQLSEMLNLAVKGDINGDEKVTAVDAMLIAQLASGKRIDEVMYSKADLNSDGKVTAVDAMLAARYASGKLSTL